MLCVMLTEGALFAYLLFSYVYYAVQLDPGWMPARHPSLLLAAPNTLVLCPEQRRGLVGRACHAPRPTRQALIGLGIGVLLGILFIAMQLRVDGQPFWLRTSVYGSLFFTITGFHMAHVVVGVMVAGDDLPLVGAGLFRHAAQRPVLIVCIYWHFVDAVWLVVFATLYLSPYLTSARYPQR